MVTPFAWSQPHPVNEHVRAASDELRRRGHEVVVLAPSNRAVDLAQGRRALRRLGAQGEPLSGVVALGPAVPVSRKSRLGVPIGVRANLELALGADSFDVLHAHEPGLPSLSYLALRDSRALSVATFHSPERLAYPPGKKQRERLLSRIDGLTAVGRRDAVGGSGPLPGRLSVAPVRDRARPHPRLPARRPVPLRVARRRARARAGGPTRAARASRLGARLRADEPAFRPALRSPGASRPSQRSHRARRREQGAPPGRRRRARPRAAWPAPFPRRGGCGGSAARRPGRCERAAGARGRRARPTSRRPGLAPPAVRGG